MSTRVKWGLALAALTLVFVGCASEDEGSADKGCPVGKCDNVDPSELACEVNNASGRDMGEGFLLGRKDPIAEKVLKPGGDCPTTYAEVMAKLRETDVEGCERGACPTCDDSRKNGNESDADCGGDVCSACTDGQSCNVNADCVSGNCDSGTCGPASCEDGEKNGTESSADCGGSCDACANGQACGSGSDCESGNCEGGFCVASTCTDSSQGEDETDVDCGGPDCGPCVDGSACAASDDCVSGVCTEGACVAATCDDGVRNSDEIGVDCGGSCEAGCAARTACSSGDDCESGICDSVGGRCLSEAPECTPNLRTGINTMVVSETAQLMDTPTSYRLATTRRCDDRDQFELFFSLFGVRAGGGLPSDAEVISFNSTTKLFNYYALEGGEWTWFGDSTDMVRPDASSRCATCHTGGGLIMKELDTPWVHWEGHHDTPGAKELVDAHEDLGTKSSGSRMESLVNKGNREWNPVRVQFFKSQGDVKGLLKPLFCTVEVNLDNGADFASSKMSSVKADFLLDPQFKSFGSVSISNDDYEAAIAAQNHKVEGVTGDFNDTLFDFVYPERSKADIDYVKKLKDAGLVDENFIEDVLIVDFTNPIFSEARCGLLEHAPELDAGDITLEAIRDGFIANLEAASPADGTPAAQLLANLQNADDSADHDAAIKTFWDACGARDKKMFIEDMVALATIRRELARTNETTHGVFEFPATMPVGDILFSLDVKPDPVSCELVEP